MIKRHDFKIGSRRAMILSDGIINVGDAGVGF